MVQQLQQQTAASRAEIVRLREELQTRGRAAAPQTSSTSNRPLILPRLLPSWSSGSINSRAIALLTGKVNDEYQTKVESASKYRVRFSGMVLFNLFGNSGYFDNLDVPTWVTRPDPVDSAGAVGGTLRQTILGFEAFGPDLMGARTSANINFDFEGGFPATYNGVDSGLVRLRTAAVGLGLEDPR